MAGSTNKFIIDASYILSFLLSDEKIQETEEVFDKFSAGEIRLYAPHLLTFEVLNALNVAVLRKRINFNVAQELAEYFLNLAITTLTIDPLKTLDLAHAKNLTFYDASYLYLSQAQNAPLLTLDKKLQSLNS